jgi:multidrug efflux pump subunit AcrB
MRKRIVPLAAVCLTTVSGSLPLLFLSGSGNGAFRSLAFVGVFGVLASFFGAFTVVPALAALSPRLFETFKYSVGAKETSSRPGGSVGPVVKNPGQRT